MKSKICWEQKNQLFNWSGADVARMKYLKLLTWRFTSSTNLQRFFVDGKLEKNAKGQIIMK